jgi:hypothetical protein
MTYIILAASGLVLGYLLGTTRRGFVTVAVVAMGSVVVQIWQVLTSSNSESMTLLPVVAGAVVVPFMLLGALTKRRSRDASNAG